MYNPNFPFLYKFIFPQTVDYFFKNHCVVCIIIDLNLMLTLRFLAFLLFCYCVICDVLNAKLDDVTLHRRTGSLKIIKHKMKLAFILFLNILKGTDSTNMSQCFSSAAVKIIII